MLKKRKTILCIPYTYTLSHISRPLLLAKELRRRGHNLIFAGESSNIKFIRQEGFKVLSLYEPDPDLLYGNIREGRLKFVDDNEIGRMILADLELYRKTNPDIVLTDGRFTAPISTHIARLRHAAIVNVSSTEYRALPYIPFFEWLSRRDISKKNNILKILDILNIKIEMFVFDHAMDTFKKLSHKHGLKKTVTATNCLAGKDITLLPDIPEYFPTRKLPDNYHYIGPLTLKSDIPPPIWWPPKNDGKFMIYITMGSTGIGRFFYKIYEHFKKTRMRAIITTGGQIEGLPRIDGTNLY